MGSTGTKDTGGKKQFDETKAGTTYQGLPFQLRANIRQNLQLSDAMRENINQKELVKMSDEWTAGLKGIKEKRKVITRYENGRLFYDVKSGNKYLLRDGTVEQAANQVAVYYKKYIK